MFKHLLEPLFVREPIVMSTDRVILVMAFCLFALVGCSRSDSEKQKEGQRDVVATRAEADAAKAKLVKGSAALAKPPEGKSGEVPTPSQQAELAAIRQRTELAEKITAALDLCGKVESYGVKAMDLGSTIDIYSIARQELMKTKLSVELPIAAKKVPQNYKDASIIVKTTKQPALDEVQAILGKEDSTEEDEKASVTWYKYGWCHFGVADDMKVTSVRADCNQIMK